MTLRPSHQAVLDKAREGFRAFIAILSRDRALVLDLALFALDLRSPAGERAGTELLGSDRVVDQITTEVVPMVTFPIAGESDIATMVGLVAPELLGLLGRQPGMVTVVLVDCEGESAILWLAPRALLT